MKVGAIPGGLEVSRRGETFWERDGLQVTASIMKNHQGEMDWVVQFADVKFAEAMARFGKISVLVRGVDNDPAPWPSTDDTQALSVLYAGLGEAAQFVADRSDLAGLLAEKNDVVRDRVYAWLSPASFPARAVKSLILARDIGDNNLIDSVLVQLSNDTVELTHGRMDNAEVRKSALNWAKQYSKALGVEIPLKYV
jgi:hypothetical protein